LRDEGERVKDGFILIPDDIMVRTDLTTSHKVVMCLLARIQGSSAVCYPSLQYIADSCGMSRSQVKRVIGDLVARKEIIRFHHAKQSNTYSVPWATARNLRKKWAVERAKRAVS
jgi:hypothetical protein